MNIRSGRLLPSKNIKVKIYTKTGDRGYTSLIGGKRVLKNHERIEAYGSMDELISFIGLLRDSYSNKKDQEILLWIQDRLMVSSSLLAADCGDCIDQLPSLKPADVKKLEKEIDRMENSLEPLSSFIIPGGHPTVSICHVCRTVCRRVERNVTNLKESNKGEDLVVQYLNRLADYLFVLARYIALELKAEEIPWNPKL